MPKGHFQGCALGGAVLKCFLNFLLPGNDHMTQSIDIVRRLDAGDLKKLPSTVPNFLRFFRVAFILL
jgi:hypothetical protein